MGYTHYWKPKVSNDEDFKNFSLLCKKLNNNLPEKTNSAGGFYENDFLEIADGVGKRKPTFDNTIVNFNGKGKLSHETFQISKTCAEWDFCKTARKPYDLLVVACLILAWQILDYRFSSDGFTDYNGKKDCDDLLPAMNFYNKVMKPEIPITEEMLWMQRE